MNMIPSFLPWQLKTAGVWLSRRERFAHAWLIHGLEGIGKRQFALAGAASLLCESPQQGLACGKCCACQWIAGGNHPDLRRIRPEAMAVEEGAEAEESAPGTGAAKKAPSKEIRIDQLRALTSWFNTATHRGGWRVAVLYPAQALNTISANALLKILEEPPEHTVFLIVADAPDRLLPTLVSRCRRLPLAVPDHAASVQWLNGQGLAQADEWLAAAGGAPLLALQQAQSGTAACPDWLGLFLAPLARAQAPDVGALADLLEKQAASVWIDILQRLFLDLLLAASGAPIRYFPDLHGKIQAIAHSASMPNLAQTAHWLVQQRATASHPLNAKLLTHSALQRVALACLPAR
jgi:DNA polymerase-3 subunit delta'